MEQTVFIHLRAHGTSMITAASVRDFMASGIDFSKENFFLGLSVMHLLVADGNVPAVKAVFDVLKNQPEANPGSLSALDVALLSYHPDAPEMLNYLTLSGHVADGSHAALWKQLKEKHGEEIEGLSL